MSRVPVYCGVMLMVCIVTLVTMYVNVRHVIQDYPLKSVMRPDVLTVANNRSNIIFYNRVPKCASTTTYNLLKRLSTTNHYVYNIYHNYPLTFFYRNRSEEEQLVDAEFARLKQSNKKVLAIEHLYFKDFTQCKGFGNDSLPIYINLVREPLERLQSGYYFIRFQPTHIRNMSAEMRNMSYSQCVLRNEAECTQSEHYMRQISFFCGPAIQCRLPDMGALEQAKRNVIAHYAVVGVMDQLRDFYVALEWRFPQWFSGAARVYDNWIKEKASVQNKLEQIPHSRALDPEAEAIMKKLLEEEYEFYYFIRQRFHILMGKVKLSEFKAKFKAQRPTKHKPQTMLR